MSSIEDVANQLAAGRQHIEAAPAVAAELQWREIGIDRVAEVVGEALALLTLMRVGLAEAGQTSAEVHHNAIAGLAEFQAATHGSDSPPAAKLIEHTGFMADRSGDAADSVGYLAPRLDFMITRLGDVVSSAGIYEAYHRLATTSAQIAVGFQTSVLDQAEAYNAHITGGAAAPSAE